MELFQNSMDEHGPTIVTDYRELNQQLHLLRDKKNHEVFTVESFLGGVLSRMGCLLRSIRSSGAAPERFPPCIPSPTHAVTQEIIPGLWWKKQNMGPQTSTAQCIPGKPQYKEPGICLVYTVLVVAWNHWLPATSW